MIWEPFVLALFLGLIVSAGLYFAYLWPSVEPVEPVEPSDAEPARAAADSPPPAEEPAPTAAPTSEPTSEPASPAS